MEVSEAIRLLENHIRYKYPDYTLEDIEATNSSGYWRVKNGCPGVKIADMVFVEHLDLVMVQLI